MNASDTIDYNNKQNKMKYDEILNYEMNDNDAGVNTIKEYLELLLLLVLEEKEGFDGKRPFGNSDWQYELYYPLIKGGFVKGKFDEGDIIDFDEQVADTLISELVMYQMSK